MKGLAMLTKMEYPIVWIRKNVMAWTIMEMVPLMKVLRTLMVMVQLDCLIRKNDGFDNDGDGIR